VKLYSITDPEFFGKTPKQLEISLHKLFQNHTPDFICFRDKTNYSSNTYHDNLAETFINTIKTINPAKTKIFINTHFHLAKKLNFDGVHLTSKQFTEIEEAKSLGLEVIISTHNNNDIQLAMKYNTDYVTYSPIFTTPNKGNPKGLEDLKETVDTMPLKIFALGGIVTKNHVEQIKNSGAYGFASIRYFI